MRLGIRYQLLLPLITLMAGVVAMSTWTALSSARAVARHFEKQLQDLAATAKQVTIPRTQQALRLMKGLLGAEILICDGQKRPVLDDKGKPIATLETLPEQLPDPAETTLEELGPRVQVGGQTFFCHSIPLGPETQPGLYLHYLYIFYPEILLNDAISQAVRPALVVGSLGGLAAFILAASLAGRVTRRIQDMGRRTRQIAGGDFSPMPLPRRNDELRDLARSINDMAQRLAQLQETVLRTERLRLLGQVSGGLAHQLRNAVTGANLAVQMHAGECPVGSADEPLAVALRQLTLVEMHLKRFLNVGKDLELRLQPCSLPPLVEEAITLLGPKCRHAGIDLRWHKVSDGPNWDLQGDPGQLSHLFVNVLTNAIEAAGPGGWVSVRLSTGERPDGRQAMIEVLDSGPGVSPEIAPRLFDPFVTGKPEGVGLGLTVARQVAEAHGGRISWSRESEGTCFRIELRLDGGRDRL